MKLDLKKNKGFAIALSVFGLIALGFGGLIYLAHSQLGEEIAAIESKTTELQNSKKKVTELPTLEKRVIILREVVKEYLKILPDSKEVTDFISTLQKFQEETGLQITELKDTSLKGAAKPAAKGDTGFEKVSYAIKVEADVWKFLAFLNRVESYERFVRVPKVDIAAGERDKEDDSTKTRHKFAMDLETFTFNPTGAAKPADIKNYERRVVELEDEILRAKDKILDEPYDFHGPRGRRDPFIDPRLRVPAEGADEGMLVKQVEIIDGLRAEVARIGQMVLDYDKASQMIRRFELRRDIEQSITQLLDRVSRVEKDGKITYLPLIRRLQRDVVEAVADLRGRFDPKGPSTESGPNKEDLLEIAHAMRQLLADGQFVIAMDRYRLFADRFAQAESDPERKPLIDEMKRMHRQAEMALDFGKKKIQVDGIIVSEEGSVVVINGRSYGEGDYVDDDLLVRRILSDSIEFQFKDVVISKKI